MEEELINSSEDIEYFNRSRELAYGGRPGRQRRDFCIGYIKHKKAVLERVRREIAEQEKQGMQFTCHKGCSYCCVLYIEAGIAECEAIVYYLYNNINAFLTFLEQYPAWRHETERHGDLARACQAGRAKLRREKDNVEANRREALDSLMDYQSLDVPCPFLHNGACSIYEVRPYACAVHYVTTPADWCSPFHPGEPLVYRAKPGDDMLDRTLYNQPLPDPIIVSMPLTVYEILSGGIPYIIEVTGLKDLEEVMNGQEDD